MTEKLHCVYKHTSPSGKVYIGVTSVVPEKRWENGFGYRYNTHFWRAIVKYGWENFEHEIVVNGLTKDQAYRLEKELISAYRSTDPDFGYNITEGGLGGSCGTKDSLETRKRKSESAKIAWEKRTRTNVPRRLRPRYGHKKMPVMQKTPDGVPVKLWSSMCEIERELGIPTGWISECCRGKRLTVKGYKWDLAEVEA